MTVLGSGNEKEDKEQLVGKVDVTTVMPTRHRLVKLQRRRSIITLILSIGFLLIFLCGIFLTVCFIKRIGPFKRHFSGMCPVGSKRFNGHKRVYESYEVTDKYAMIHVPQFNYKQRMFDSVRTLHVFDKQVTVIQHNGMCFVKPMMKFQMLRSDWFEKLRLLSHHHLRTPKRFIHYNLQIIRPQLPSNYLRDEVHHLADAMCNSRPVFRLVFRIHPHVNPHVDPHVNECNVKCESCEISEQKFIWKIIEGKQCRVCLCLKKKGGEKEMKHGPLSSTNRVDSNCKTIRCENKCVNKGLIGCVRCRCIDNEQAAAEDMQKKPLINTLQLAPLIVNAESSHNEDTTGGTVDMKDNKHSGFFKEHHKVHVKENTEQPLFHEKISFQPIFDYEEIHRHKRATEAKNCKKVLEIVEGYTPLDLHGSKFSLDHIYDC